MKDINLEESKIKIEEKWFSAEEIAQEIQKKIQAGDMKLSAYASALEKLTVAIENSHVIDVKLTLTKEEYNRFKSLGKGTDTECIRKAVRMFMASKKQAEKQSEKKTVKQSLKEKYATPTNESSAKSEPDKIIGNCIKCKTSIEIQAETDPEKRLCSDCVGTDTDELSDSQIKFKDHFLG